MRGAASARARVVCLLPARNAAADLPDYFASAARFCDAIVALDDGSTDATRALLAASPLVQILLSNPRRADYRGWDDAANRNRLLAAAAALQPEWIVSVDADERIDAGDAAALRAFLDGDALPGCAYGFRTYAMWPDLEHYWPTVLWDYRLFGFQPGHRFPSRQLHVVPIPESIPAHAWINTTLRIQHVGGLAAARRPTQIGTPPTAAPHRQLRDEDASLREDASAGPRRWESRPAKQPVLWGASAAEMDPDREPATSSAGTSAAQSPLVSALPRPLPPGSGRIIRRIETSAPLVALTLDDDIDHDALGALAERNVKLTLFLTGAWVQARPDTAQRALADGHELGNHTWSHPRLNRGYGFQGTVNEIRHANEAIAAVTGMASIPAFRPPYGEWNVSVVAGAAAVGYDSYLWDVDSPGWKLDSKPEAVVGRVLVYARAGSIVVMHPLAPADNAALGAVVDGLRSRGLEPCRISDLIHSAPDR